MNVDGPAIPGVSGGLVLLDDVPPQGHCRIRADVDGAAVVGCAIDEHQILDCHGNVVAVDSKDAPLPAGIDRRRHRSPPPQTASF